MPPHALGASTRTHASTENISVGKPASERSPAMSALVEPSNSSACLSPTRFNFAPPISVAAWPPAWLRTVLPALASS